MKKTNSQCHKSTKGIKNKIGKIIEAAIEAVNPYSLVAKQVKISDGSLHINDKSIDLGLYKKIHVLGAGKGVPLLFKGLEKKIGDRIFGGLIVSLTGQTFSHPVVKSYPGSHPVPDSSSIKAGVAMVDYVKKNIEPEDLVFFLVTGGASALIINPIPPVKLEDIIKINQLLLKSGAEINEINCIRKHLSQIKGGQLAKLIYPARLISLIISDIIDSPLENIGSGPSIGDSSTFIDALDILHKYSLVNKCPRSILRLFTKGLKRVIGDTPSPVSSIFSNNIHFLMGENITALKAAQKSAQSMGITSRILTSKDKGEAVGVARQYAGFIRETLSSKIPYPRPVLFLSGGELTVTVRGKGKGGRNQEFILALLDELKDEERPFFILSIGTDGLDGPTDSAGAWIDHQTMKKVNSKNLNIQNYLNNNNSYQLFRTINQLVKFGATGTNVMDLRLFYLPR